MGLSDDGNDPVALVQTRCPCARVHGADQECIAHVVPSGAGCETRCNLVGLGASQRAGLVRLIESPSGSRAQQVSVAQGGGRMPCACWR
jgi:hypothetical protein